MEITIQNLAVKDKEILRLQHLVDKYENGIRRHKDSWLNGDDKCWKDNEELYKLLPEGFVAPIRDEAVELELCKQYIASCHHPRITYCSPQRRIEELVRENQALKDQLC